MSEASSPWAGPLAICYLSSWVVLGLFLGLPWALMLGLGHDFLVSWGLVALPL